MALDSNVGYCLYYPQSLSFGRCSQHPSTCQARVRQAWRHAAHQRRHSTMASIRECSTSFATAGTWNASAEVSIGSLRKQPLTNPDLVAVAMRAPRAVICLISALAYHELTTQVPHAVDLALPSHAQAPKIREIPIRVFWFPPSSFNAGVEVVEIDKTPVRIYSAEKTVADCFKYRNKIGLDVAIEALRIYRHTRRKSELSSHHEVRPS